MGVGLAGSLSENEWFNLSAQRMLERYGFVGCTIWPICYSENHTYRVTRYDSTPVAVFRICRPGYRNVAQLQSEVDWLHYLHYNVKLDGIEIIKPIPSRDGSYIQAVEFEDGSVLHGVAFAHMSGCQPDENDSAAMRHLFGRLGALAAALHSGGCAAHDADKPSHAFDRPVWDAPAIFGPDATWGDWRAFPGLSAQDTAVLEQAESRAFSVLTAYGRPHDRFGLIHADMRLANLLVEGAGSRGTLKLLDFDDCAYSWHLFDLAAALSFIEARPDAPALANVWLDAYQRMRPLSPADLAIVPALIMARRLQLTGWLASRADSDPAPGFSCDWVQGTLSVATRYLQT